MTRDGFLRDINRMIDDMHEWCRRGGPKLPETGGAVGGVHVYDSIAVIDKVGPRAPFHTMRGEGGRDELRAIIEATSRGLARP